MRVLYVGDLQVGSTALHRMKALADLGLAVSPFDTYPYHVAGSRIARSLRHRLAIGANVSRLNRRLLTAAAHRELDWVWIDKGVWVYPGTIRTLATREHFAGDSMILDNRSRHFIRSIPLYDLLITTKRSEQDLYRNLGGAHVEVMLHGYDANLFRPLEAWSGHLAPFRSDVCFVGRCEPHYRRRIAAAAETGASVAVWGDWKRGTVWTPSLRRLVRGPGVWEEDYVRALNSTKIGLGLLKKGKGPDSSTTRSFEIPACGTFLLAERSSEHLQLFEEGKEAEFFDSDGEMREKIDWYLDHEAEREQIAAAGRARCIRSGYSYLERMRSAVAMMRGS